MKLNCFLNWTQVWRECQIDVRQKAQSICKEIQFSPMPFVQPCSCFWMNGTFTNNSFNSSIKQWPLLLVMSLIQCNKIVRTKGESVAIAAILYILCSRSIDRYWTGLWVLIEEDRRAANNNDDDRPTTYRAETKSSKAIMATNRIVHIPPIRCRLCSIIIQRQHNGR